jgi:hypothetical protein
VCLCECERESDQHHGYLWLRAKTPVTWACWRRQTGDIGGNTVVGAVVDTAIGASTVVASLFGEATDRDKRLCNEAANSFKPMGLAMGVGTGD